MNFLKETFTYFARYVTPDVVGRFFVKGTGDTAYNNFKAAAKAAAKSLYPVITDYIFGVDEQVIGKRISEVKGVYLFVDYGNIVSYLDGRNVKSDRVSLAVTVAKPMSANIVDQAQQLMLADELLDVISGIRASLRADKGDPFVTRLEFPNTVMPFVAPSLSNSYGWTLMLELNGVDII